MRRFRGFDRSSRAQIVRALLERVGPCCGICETALDPSAVPEHPAATTIDHIVPISAGGEFGHERAIENLRLAHAFCNEQLMRNPDYGAAWFARMLVRRSADPPSGLSSDMSCRDQILEVVRDLTGPRSPTFTLDAVVARMRARKTKYDPSTIRTHVVSRMCANAPNHHSRTYDDFVRVGRGLYQFRRPDALPPVEIGTPPDDSDGQVSVAAPALRVGMTSSEFEVVAREAMERRYGVPLPAGSVPGVPKRFDCVSAAGDIVGDVKYYTLVRGLSLPPAKYATIAEYVWLLQKTVAPDRFMIFGNDIRVAKGWLKRYGHLVDGISFFFMNDSLEIEPLN